jgi:hypothetical protein
MSDPLCEICEELGIADAFGREYTIVMDDLELGTVADIRERGEVCTLCSIIKQELEQETCERDDNCYLHRSIYCTIWFEDREEQLGANTARVGLEDSTGKRTMRFEVILAPAVSTGFMGPLLPFGIQREVIENARPRGLLQFQELEGHSGSKNTTNWERPSLARGRVVNPHKANLELVASWLRICEDGHGQLCCKDPWTDLAAAIDGLLLIDVTLACIVEAPTEYRYVALSYCWGDAPTLKHVKQNSAQLRKLGSLINASIPTTIRDAMAVTASLKERYLWVDALCIVQDDPIASQQQLSQMGEIYSHAFLTIVAAAGPRADSGLPGVRPGSRNVSRSSLNLDKLCLTTVIDKGDDFGSISQTDWSTRAWTMQEKLLSRRRLIFTKEQVYWRCRTSTWREELRLEDTTAQRFFMGVSKPGEIDEIAFGNSEEMPMFELHRNLVRTYLRRQLGYHSDSLNAFNGILHILSNLRHQETFIWGLLESQFSSALNWSFRGGGKRNNASTTAYATNGREAKLKFPSWSWTSCAGGINNLWYAASQTYKEIDFYKEGIDGELIAVLESPSQNFTAKIESSTHWKGKPQIIESVFSTISQPNTFIDSGNLVFWSSIAPCIIYRWDVPEVGLGGYDRGYAVRLEAKWDTKNHYRWFNVYDLLDEDDLPWKPYTSHLIIASTSHLPRTAGLETSTQTINTATHTVDAYLVVLGRKDENNLTAFIVRFQDGVASKIGLADFSESRWNDVDSRQWELVRLQ